jgi:hypothetical protein
MAILPPSPSDNSWTEPESARNTETPPVYPYNNIQQTESGHSFEMDDTPTRERVRLQHRIGTFLEMHPDGDEVHKVYGTGYEIYLKGKNGEERVREGKIYLKGKKREEILMLECGCRVWRK